MKQKIKFTVLLFFFSSFIALLPADASEPSHAPQSVSVCTSDTGQSSTYSQAYEWRYKYINGKLYKRLYDHTANRWVGNWILV